MDRYLKFLLVIAGLVFPLSGATDSISLQRKNFLAAEKALEKGKYKTFERLVSDLREYPLYPYLLYKRLIKTPGKIDRIVSFLEQYSETRYPIMLRWNLLKHLASKERWLDYLAHYKKTVSPELQCHYYWSLYQTGRADEALIGARMLWVAGRSRPSACDKLFAKFQTSELFSSELAWQRFILSMKKGNIGLAKYLRRFIPKEQRNTADFWLKVRQNPRIVLKCDQWNPEFAHMASLFVYGVDRLARTDPALAGAVWTKRKQAFNIKTDDKGYIESRLGIALAIRRDPSAAQFLAVLEPELSDTSLREWRIRDALMRMDWDTVLDYVDQLAKPERALPAWQYWRARSLDQLGNTVEAHRIFQEVAKERGFYGFLSADKLGLDYAWSDQPIEVADTEIRRLENTQMFRAVQEFRHFGRESLARREWWHAVRQLNPKEILVAAKLAQQWGWDQTAIFTVAKVKHWDDLGLRFPLLYRKIIDKNATQKGLRSSFVYGVMRQESAFNPNAHSRAGARGLMQIMPATGRQIARGLNEKWRSSRVLYKPDVNIHYGTTYLGQLLSQFQQNFPLAIASYNAGEHRIAQWLPVDKSLPADIWIENIPFKETRHYVMTVLSYFVIYHQRLENELLRLSSLVGIVKPKRAKKRPHKHLAEFATCKP